MNVTLMIGNGFDLNMGLKTGYRDFYKVYTEKKSASKAVEIWKGKIRDDINLWADLEGQLKAEAVQLPENGIPGFLEFVEDLTDELAEYFDGVTERMYFSNQNMTFQQFQHGVDHIDGKIAECRMGGPLKEESVLLQEHTILNFNYTDCIERIQKDQKTPFRVIHPHGDLKSSLVLGIHDLLTEGPSEGRFIDLSHIEAFSEIDRWMIKQKIIQGDSELQGRWQDARKVIDESDVVCVYGMSLGESDGIWWEYLLNWLAEKSDRVLLLFLHRLNTFAGRQSRAPRRQAQMRGETEKTRFVDSYLSQRRFAKMMASGQGNLMDRIYALPDKGIFEMKADQKKNPVA